MTENKKQYLKKCFEKLNQCKFVTSGELDDMIELTKTALFYLKLNNTGSLLLGISMELEKLEALREQRNREKLEALKGENR